MVLALILSLLAAASCNRPRVVAPFGKRFETAEEVRIPVLIYDPAEKRPIVRYRTFPPRSWVLIPTEEQRRKAAGETAP